MHDDFTGINRINTLYRTELKSEIDEINGFSGTKVKRQTQHDTTDRSPNDGMLTSQPHFPSAEFSTDAVQQNKATGERKRQEFDFWKVVEGFLLVKMSAPSNEGLH